MNIHPVFSFLSFLALPLVVLPLVGLFGVAAFVFWICMLVEAATKEPAQGNDKIVWILVIALTSWIGALIYLLYRRPQRIKLYGK